MFGSLAGLFGVNSHSPDDHDTDVKKEEPPDANPDASKAPLEPKSLHQAPFSGNSPVKYGSGPQQYCLVESRQSETGKHLETYITCALADKGTTIPKELIQQGTREFISSENVCFSTNMCNHYENSVSFWRRNGARCIFSICR